MESNASCSKLKGFKNNSIIIIIINIKDRTLWSVPSPELQLLAPTLLLRSSNKQSCVCKWKNSSINTQIEKGYLTLLAVRAPEEGKTEKTEEFYETLQDQVDKISKNDYIVVAGDYNARVGNIPIDGILGTNGEITTNSNGHRLNEFLSVNDLKITNTFFRYKEIPKMTWNVKKVRRETILKIYSTLFLPTFLYRPENWTLTALQRRRFEAAEMKLLRPLAG